MWHDYEQYCRRVPRYIPKITWSSQRAAQHRHEPDAFHYPSLVGSVIRRTTSQQKGQTLVLLCDSPATNRPVKFPDQSGHRPHDTGNLRVIFYGWWTQWYCLGQDLISPRCNALHRDIGGHKAISGLEPNLQFCRKSKPSTQ